MPAAFLLNNENNDSALMTTRNSIGQQHLMTVTENTSITATSTTSATTTTTIVSSSSPPSTQLHDTPSLIDIIERKRQAALSELRSRVIREGRAEAEGWKMVHQSLRPNAVRVSRWC